MYFGSVPTLSFGILFWSFWGLL